MKKTFLTASVCAILAISSNAFAQDSQTARKANPKGMNVPQDMKVASLEQKPQTKQNGEINSEELNKRAEIEKNASCQTILNECKKLGFVAGGFKEGKGLWRNCFSPVVHGKSANLNGQDVAVTVNANDVASCKVAVKEIRKEKKEGKAESRETHKAKHHKPVDSTATTPAAKQ